MQRRDHSAPNTDGERVLAEGRFDDLEHDWRAADYAVGSSGSWCLG